ncbi:MAG: hypothetical protein Q9168_001688 [Polycauliona sp. 1 TL-2023]
MSDTLIHAASGSPINIANIFTDEDAMTDDDSINQWTDNEETREINRRNADHDTKSASLNRKPPP